LTCGLGEAILLHSSCLECSILYLLRICKSYEYTRLLDISTEWPFFKLVRLMHEFSSMYCTYFTTLNLDIITHNDNITYSRNWNVKLITGLQRPFLTCGEHASLHMYIFTKKFVGKLNMLIKWESF
jgi:hypothetical protein